MAKLSKNEEKEVKPTKDKAVKHKKEKVEGVTKVETEVEKPKVIERKNKMELKVELRKMENDILVEISNISSMHCSYYSKNGDPYFDFDPDEYTEVTLGELREIVKMSPGYFKDFSVIITKVLNEEYSVRDVMEYLSISKFYREIDSPQDDFIRDMLDMDYDDLENLLESKKTDKLLIRNLACKAVYLTNSEDEDYEIPRNKDELISRYLGDNRKTLFSIRY